MRFLIPKRKFLMLTQNQSVPILSTPPTLTLTQASQQNSNSANTATWTAVAIGSPGSFTTRRVIIVLCSNGGTFNGTLNSLIINGTTTATQHLFSNTRVGIAIYSANVPTGSTMDFVLTQQNTFFAATFAAFYTVDDAKLISTTPTTGLNSAATGTSITSASFTQTINGVTVLAVNGDNLWGSAVTVSGFTLDDGGNGTRRYFGHQTVPATVTAGISASWLNAVNSEIGAASWR
jgi:hypothetical protein